MENRYDVELVRSGSLWHLDGTEKVYMLAALGSNSYALVGLNDTGMTWSGVHESLGPISLTKKHWARICGSGTFTFIAQMPDLDASSVLQCLSAEDWKEEIKGLLLDSKTIAAIKCCRKHTGWGLVEAKNYVYKVRDVMEADGFL